MIKIAPSILAADLIDIKEEVELVDKNGAEFFAYDKLGSFKPGNKPGVILIENVEGLLLTKASKIKLLV